MKILYDHQIFSAQVYGGVSRYFCEIGSRIASMPEIDANVLCPFYANNHLRDQSGLKVHGKHVPRLPYSTLAMRTVNAAIAPFFGRVRTGVRIYHETYFSRLDIAPHGAARVITLHDMIHEKFAEQFPWLDRTSDAKKAALRRADHVICVSENTRRDLLGMLAIDPRRVTVVPHGSSLQWHEPKPPSKRNPQLLYVGARGHYKNFASLVKAFALSRLPAEGFSLICFGGGAFSTAEQSLLSEYGLLQRVTQLSGGDPALLQLLKESTALVYPSLYEGFGIPPLEAMSCGCPVACSNTSSLPEVVGSAAESFDPYDIDSIRTAIEAIAFSAVRSAELIAAGYSQANRFSWDRAARATLETYRILA